jgi:FkbH-like protein
MLRKWRGLWRSQPSSAGIKPPRLSTRRLRLYGGCLAENLATIGQRQGWQVAHQLYQSGLHEQPGFTQADGLDAALVVLAPRTVFGQVAQQLLGFHDADLLYQKGLAPEAIKEAAEQILASLCQQFAQGIDGRVPTFFTAFVEPPPTSSGIFTPRKRGGIYDLIRHLNDALAAYLESQRGQYFLEINDLLRRHGDAKVYDGYDLCFAHASLKHEDHGVLDQIFNRLEEMLQALEGQQSIKLIITDLDNTLWKWVLAEEEQIIPSDHTEGWPIGYAEALIECKHRGILLAIASKNDELPTRERFAQVWYGRIRLEDFCSIKINWRPKSDNIAEILREVNVLPEQVLFIDDNPLEIAEVQRAFPSLRTLSGDPHRWRQELLFGVSFQVPHLSDEARQKTALLQAKITRDQELALGDRDGYLRDLQLQVEIAEIGSTADRRFGRALELLNKTNQFNTTGQRWSEASLQGFLQKGGRLRILLARDRMIDHGLVSVALLQSGALQQMVLSCRVFGLGLEEAFLTAWPEARIGMPAVWQDTGKNATARQFLQRYFAWQEPHWVLATVPELLGHLQWR